jgi:chaperonin GroEL (HSP60 family)
LATRLKKWATSVSGQKSLAILRFAQVFETIPLQLSYNSGKDGIDLLSRLRSMHMDGSDVYGISSKGKIMNMFDLGVFEPLKVKKLLLSMLRETLIQLLRIDNVIIAKQIKGNVTTRDVAPIKDYNVKEIA